MIPISNQREWLDYIYHFILLLSRPIWTYFGSRFAFVFDTCVFIENEEGNSTFAVRLQLAGATSSLLLLSDKTTLGANLPVPTQLSPPKSLCMMLLSIIRLFGPCTSFLAGLEQFLPFEYHGGFWKFKIKTKKSGDWKWLSSKWYGHQIK